MRLNYLGLPVLVLLAGWALASPAHPPAEPGAVEGRVTYTGTPPQMRPIDMRKEPTCAKMDHPPQLTQSVVAGPGNALQYVVVYISAGETSSPAPAETVRMDQKGCMFVPHVLPLQVGQVIQIYTDDPFSHNIHPLPKVNPEWNKAQPAGARPILTSWDKPEFIEVKCNIHAWMHGYFAVLKTSHYAVTDNQGHFGLNGLAPGTYTVTAWHEQFGLQSQQVNVGEAETKSIDFVYKVR